jgi:hypothetical protein
MSIKIELVFDTIEEAADALSQLAAKFLSATSSNTLDIAQHTSHVGPASPTEATEAALPVKRGRGRPPKIKPEEDTPPCDTQADPVGEATPSEAPAEEPKDNEDDLQNVIAKLTEVFKAGGDNTRAKIKQWRDSIGLARMADLKAEHIPGARNLLASLEV